MRQAGTQGTPAPRFFFSFSCVSPQLLYLLCSHCICLCLCVPVCPSVLFFLSLQSLSLLYFMFFMSLHGLVKLNTFCVMSLLYSTGSLFCIHFLLSLSRETEKFTCSLILLVISSLHIFKDTFVYLLFL